MAWQALLIGVHCKKRYMNVLQYNTIQWCYLHIAHQENSDNITDNFVKLLWLVKFNMRSMYEINL